jgi:PAS domain S-box-containing protein
MTLESFALGPILDRWFVTGQIPLELCIAYRHDKWLVWLSYVVAAFASYTALHLTDRIRSAPAKGIRAIWLAIAGTSMGCGIFAMHFIAMLAVRISIPVQYDITETILSAVFAVVASGIAFHFSNRRGRNHAGLAVGAVILGSGIGLMHYTGMAALRMPAHVYYDPFLFALSVVVAVTLSGLALYVLHSNETWHRLSRFQARLCAALVMGLAVTVMHYTGMFATYFYPDTGGVASGTTFDGTLMAIAVGSLTLMISGIAVSAALLDRRAEIAEAQRQQSESFLKTTIDNSADGILTFDEEMFVRTCNPAGGQIFGREARDVVGERLDRLIENGIDLPPVEFGSALRGEARSLGGGGDARAIEYTVSGMRYGGRRIFNCIVRDITERKRQEEALRASEERFRNLVTNIPGVVFQRRLESDGSLSYSFVSDQIRDVLGLEPDAVMNDASKMLATLDPEDRATINRMVTSAAENHPRDQVFRATTPGGERKWVRTISRPRRMARGEVLWDGLILDVTDSVRQAEEKKDLEERLRQSQRLESLGTLAGGMAHEFNNMLVPIQGLAQLTMREVPEGGRAHQNLNTILNNSRRAAHLVEKILAFARPEEGDRTATKLFDVVTEAVDLLKATAPATISIGTDLDRSVGMVFADEVQIHQVLMNLASNARHAMEGGVGELTVGLSKVTFTDVGPARHGSLRPGTYAKLSVSDTGHGMDQATVGRIFEPFFTTKKVGKGTGLGLAVIHGIVTAHGGAIDVESAVGKGTRFDVYLPLMAETETRLAATA